MKRKKLEHADAEETDSAAAVSGQALDTGARLLTSHDQSLDDEENTFGRIMKFVNLGFIGYSLLLELVLLLVQMRKANLKLCNSYVIAQLITGLTQRATILLSAQLTAICLKQGESLGYIFGLIVGIGLIISQLRAVWIFVVGIKYNYENLLPNTARCFRLSYAGGYFANALLYKKMILDPSKASILQNSELIAEQKALKSLSGMKAVTRESALRKYFKWENPKFW